MAFSGFAEPHATLNSRFLGGARRRASLKVLCSRAHNESACWASPWSRQKRARLLAA
jgi:hypothetical protein